MLVSVIVPSRDEKKDLGGLLKDISSQENPFETEVVRVTDVSPSGKARNEGASKAKGDILVFLDDDIRFGSPDVLKKMIEALGSDEKTGVCGVSQRIPEDSNWFQRRCAKELAHIEHPVAEELEEVGMVAGACCAIKKNIFFKIGRFNERLLRGIDVEMCYRVKKSGYKVVLVPNAWIYHPPAANLLQLAALSFRDGTATAFVDKHYPELNFDVGSDGIAPVLEKKNALYRSRRYMTDTLKAVVFLRPLRLFSKIIYAAGYLYGAVLGIKKNVR